MSATSTRSPPRRLRWRHAVIAVAAAVAVAIGGVGLLYGDQIVRYATHLKGSPTHTVTWRPFPSSSCCRGTYQRSEPIHGVTHVVSGGAATTRRTGENDYTAASFSWHHFVEVAVFPDRLVLRAVNEDLRVADDATVRP